MSDKMVLSGIAIACVLIMVFLINPAQAGPTVLDLHPAAQVTGNLSPGLVYQGYLADSAGQPVTDGTYNITFNVWRGEKTAALLAQQTVLIPVQAGVFSATVAFKQNTLSGRDLFLGMQVNGGPELSREPLCGLPTTGPCEEP